MALVDLEVVEVVRRRDLDRARALLRVGVAVGDDRDLAPDQRQHDGLADQSLIALIVRVHRDRGVAQHGLGPRGGDDDVIALLPFGRLAVVIEGDRKAIGLSVSERIPEVPEAALLLLHLDFEVGERALELRVPVDEPLVAVDQALVVELDEHLEDGPGQALVHGEALARPVAGGAEALQLVDDGAAALGLPGPHRSMNFGRARAGGGRAPGAP